MDDMDEMRTNTGTAVDFSEAFNNPFGTIKRSRVVSSEKVIEPEPELVNPDGSINKTLQREEYQEAMKRQEEIVVQNQQQQEQQAQQSETEEPQTETVGYRINIKTLPEVKELAKRLIPTIEKIKPGEYALACDLAIELAMTFEGVWNQRIGDRNEQKG